MRMKRRPNLHRKLVNQKYKHIKINRASGFRDYEEILTQKIWQKIELTMDRIGNRRLVVRNEKEEYQFDTPAIITLMYDDSEIFDGHIGFDKKVRITKIEIYDPEYLPDDETDAEIYIESVEVDA
jgi:hypothetical protein